MASTSIVTRALQEVPAWIAVDHDLEDAFKQLDSAYQMLGIARDENQRDIWESQVIYWQNEIRRLVGVPERTRPTLYS